MKLKDAKNTLKMATETMVMNRLRMNKHLFNLLTDVTYNDFKQVEKIDIEEGTIFIHGEQISIDYSEKIDKFILKIKELTFKERSMTNILMILKSYFIN